VLISPAMSSNATSPTAAVVPPVIQPSSINILPSNHVAVNATSPTSAPSHQLPGPPPAHPGLTTRSSSQSLHGFTGDASGAGPLRHPRPMTAAQLHSELEQENEAVVNRLTRELSLLRAAHNASVASNGSSTSAHNEAILDSHHHPLTSPSYAIPIASRRHNRTASNASARSQTASGTVSTSYEARRSSAIPLSRQGSSASRRSRTDSPGPHGFGPADSSLAYLQQQRIPIPPPTSMPMVGLGSLPDQMSPSLLPATPRYEETAYYRAELENAKRENEALKRRIKELEKAVRGRRASDASRQRSESVSTTASMNPTVGSGAGIAPPRDAAAHAHTHNSAATHTASALMTTTASASASASAAPSAAVSPATTVATTATTASAATTPSARPVPERQVSMASSIAVGVPEEELKVGESAASQAKALSSPTTTSSIAATE
ncbi:hypothetical protein TD95_005237, partial [Thielaviopsis punctulata]